MKKKALQVLFLLIGLLSSVEGWTRTPSDTSKTEQRPELSAKVYDKVAPAMVNILCSGNKNGSGAIVGITSQGRAIILTACHVVSSNFKDVEPGVPIRFHNNIKVKLASDSNFVDAAVMPKFYGQSKDLALIATINPISRAEVISYNRTARVRPGQTVAALGFPETYAITQTVGKITRIEEEGYLFFDADIAPGSSGGPVVDKYGRMIGVSQSEDEEDNIGSALEMDTVLVVVENWLQQISSKVSLNKTWKYQKYGNFGERMLKDPLVMTSEAVLTGGIAVAVYEIFKPRVDPDILNPPGLPTNP